MPARAKIIKLPVVSRVGKLQSFNAETNTARMTISSEGARVRRYGYGIGEYYEELGHNEGQIDLGRAQTGAVNFLKNHGGYRGARIEDVLGRVYDVSVDGGKMEASVQFATRDEVQGLIKDIREGILKNVSVGYRVKELEKVGESNDVPVMRATNWELLEVSSVAIPADPSAQMRDIKTIEGYDCKISGHAADNKKESSRMDAEVKPKEEKTKVEEVKTETRADEDKARDEGIKAERSRVESITRAVKAASLSSEYAQTLIGEGVTIDQAREVIFKELETRNKSVPTPSARVEMNGLDEKKSRVEGATNALLHRSNPSRYELEASGRPYAGASLLRLAEHFVGPSAMGMTKTQICSRALSTADFPELLSNVAGKSLLTAYDLAPQTFRPWTRAGSLPDFKEQTRIRFGDMGSLRQVQEGGEYQYSDISENAEKIKLLKYGRSIKLTWETLINDDLDAFSRLPEMFAVSSRRLESKLVYDLLTGSPVLSDGVAVFHASHGNLAASGTDVTEAAMSAARVAMRKQMTLDKTDFLDLSPAFLICGPAKETAARKLLGGEITGSTTPDVNIFRGAAQLIVDPRVTNNAWFLSASPATIDTLELATLDGGRGLQLMEEVAFNSDSMMMRVRHVVGAKILDYRGLYKNPGA